MEWKSSKNKRRKGMWVILSEGDEARYKRLLPYGKK
jgi:ribosomal protein L35